MLVGAYAQSDGIVRSEHEDGDLRGAALFLHINDPHDVKLDGRTIVESPDGRYVYFSQLYVKPECRDPLGGVMWELIYKSFDRCPGAIRWAFRRVDRGSESLHVLEIPEVKDDGASQKEESPSASEISV